MTDEYQYNAKDIEAYRPINLAPEFAKQGNIGALEKTIKDLGKNIGVRDKDLEDVASIFGSPEALNSFVKVFSKKYQTAFNSQKISNLREFYGDAFKKFYTEENLPKVNDVFSSDAVYGDVLKKYNDAVRLMELESEEHKGQKEQAEKDAKELSKIVLPIMEFEKLELDKIRVPANEEALKEGLNSLYEEKKDE